MEARAHGGLRGRGAGAALGAGLRDGVGWTFGARYPDRRRARLRGRGLLAGEAAAAQAGGGSGQVPRRAGPRRLAPGAGRARRVLRRATRALEERVRVPAGAGCREVRAALRGVVRVRADRSVRGRPARRVARHGGAAGAQAAVGVPTPLRQGAGRRAAPFGLAGGRCLPRLSEGDDGAGGARHAAGLPRDLDKDARRALRERYRGYARILAAAGRAGPAGVRGARQEVRATAVIHTSADPTGMNPTSAAITAVKKGAP